MSSRARVPWAHRWHTRWIRPGRCCGFVVAHLPTYKILRRTGIRDSAPPDAPWRLRRALTLILVCEGTTRTRALSWGRHRHQLRTLPQSQPSESLAVLATQIPGRRWYMPCLYRRCRQVSYERLNWPKVRKLVPFSYFNWNIIKYILDLLWDPK